MVAWREFIWSRQRADGDYLVNFYCAFGENKQARRLCSGNFSGWQFLLRFRATNCWFLFKKIANFIKLQLCLCHPIPKSAETSRSPRVDHFERKKGPENIRVFKETKGDSLLETRGQKAKHERKVIHSSSSFKINRQFRIFSHAFDNRLLLPALEGEWERLFPPNELRKDLGCRCQRRNVKFSINIFIAAAIEKQRRNSFYWQLYVLDTERSETLLSSMPSMYLRFIILPPKTQPTCLARTDWKWLRAAALSCFVYTKGIELPARVYFARHHSSSAITMRGEAELVTLAFVHQTCWQELVCYF